jgi:SAM-dependent methyltransferase
MKDEPSGSGDSREIYARRELGAIAARWDARAKSWDHALEDSDCHLNEDDAYQRFIGVVQRRIARRKQFCAGQGVIDAGCGTGLVLTRVVPAFAWGIGVDISPEMVRVAKAKNLPKCNFIVGDCFALPSLCPKAGMIVSRGVLLSHYGREHGLALLKAVRSALAAGGFIVFDFLNEAARTQQQHAPENKTWFTGEEIKTMARDAGFSTISIAGKPNRRVLILVASTDGQTV